LAFQACYILPAIPLVVLLAAQAPGPERFRFAILGDRTGEASPGIYERIWKQVAGDDPAFVLSVGDSIEGGHDATAEGEWQDFERMVAPWRRIPLYLAPGNHDVWSEASEKLFEKYTGHPAHYSFDYGGAHFTVLDNSRSDQISAEELAFLEQDLASHAAQPLKVVISHRPSWIIPALVHDPGFPLQQLARKYGVRYVIAGHLHQMLHMSLDGVEYVSMVSSGGHLRASGKYAEGWFFGYATVDAEPGTAVFRIHALDGRVTELKDWGPAGLEEAGK